MTEFILDSFNFEIDIPTMKEKLHVKDVDQLSDQLEYIVSQSEKECRPKAIYQPFDIEERGDDFVIIGGEIFKSRVLAVNLKDVDRVFVFIATCGIEIDNQAKATDDILFKYWIDHIQNLALEKAILKVQLSIEKEFNPGARAIMTPGSIDDWPLTEQRKLFSVFGDRSKTIDVELSDSNMMLPVKSLSGIIFPSEHNYLDCQLCTIEKCPNRMAPYEHALYETHYQIKGKCS